MDHDCLLRWMIMVRLFIISFIMIKKVSPCPVTYFSKDCPLAHITLL